MEIAYQRRFEPFVMEIAHSSHAGEARRTAVQSAKAIGMDEGDAGAVAIAVTEMATNVLKHANSGKIFCAPISFNGSSGIRIMAFDCGPGIRDLAVAMQDGYSTTGTAGNGLGAVRRLSSRFDVYSLADRGTCVLAEFWPQRKMPADRLFATAAVSLPFRGESVCGDGFLSFERYGISVFMVVDGLGHGVFAAEAAREAERVVTQSDSASPTTLLQDVHDALKKTRGAAGAVAAISADQRTLLFAGIGNISATLISGEARRGMASHNGTLGHQIHKIQEFCVPWDAESVLIMHSDGLSSKWDLRNYPGLVKKHPSLISAVLYRDFGRDRDDVTVMATKNVE